VLGTTRDIYVEDTMKLVHYIPISIGNSSGCIKSDTVSTCDANWTNAGTDTVNNVSTTHWTLYCGGAVAHTALFYEWWLDSNGTVQQVMLPNDVAQGNISFTLAENKNGSVFVDVPGVCRAVDDGRIIPTAYSNTSQLFSRQWIGCLLDCNSPVHADTAPHPSATCNASIPAWVVNSTAVAADSFTGTIQTRLMLTGNLTNAANSSKSLHISTCGQLDVAGWINLSSTAIGVNAQAEAGTSLASLVVVDILTYGMNATSIDPPCVQLDPAYKNCCPEFINVPSLSAYNATFKCDGTNCSKHTKCPPLLYGNSTNSTTPPKPPPNPNPKPNPRPPPPAPIGNAAQQVAFYGALVVVAATFALCA